MLFTVVQGNTRHFQTEHQAKNLPVLLAARSAVLDRGWQIGGLFWLGFSTSEGTLMYFHLACYLKMRQKCAGLCVRWAKVSMTCAAVPPTAKEF